MSKRRKQINLLQNDSDAELEPLQIMKICYIGQLRAKFKLEVDIEVDEVVEVKWKILTLLGLVSADDK